VKPYIPANSIPTSTSAGGARGSGLDRGEGLLEALARDRERYRLGIRFAGGPNNEGVGELAGVHANDRAGGPGELALLVRAQGGQWAAHGRRSSG
jgi:hypothetical protein